jgi:hypothetical protein
LFVNIRFVITFARYIRSILLIIQEVSNIIFFLLKTREPLSLLLLVERVISKYISFRKIVYDINRINGYRNISVEIINKYNKILAESNTNIYLEDTGLKNRSTNRPRLAVSSIKVVLLSKSIFNRIRIRSYIKLITSQIN